MNQSLCRCEQRRGPNFYLCLTSIGGIQLLLVGGLRQAAFASVSTAQVLKEVGTKTNTEGDGSSKCSSKLAEASLGRFTR
jgi:hypothetical protein